MKSVSKGRIFISDANSRRALAAVRSLGRKGYSVVVGEVQASSLAGASKFCSERIVYPSPTRSPDKFISFLLNLFQTQKFEYFIPMSDQIMKLTVLHKEKFVSLVKFLVVDASRLEIALDKWKILNFALENGFDIPQTYLVDKLESVKTIADKMDYPAVIKPRRESGARGIVFVRNAGELLIQYPRIHAYYPFPLIQEAIPSCAQKFGVQSLFNSQGKLRAAVVQRFIRQFPVQGGPGSCFVSVDRPDVCEKGIRLLEKIGWKGVAQVEFLEDPRDGKLKLMEINPRFWDSLETVIRAGVDFPHLLIRILQEGDVAPVMDYQSGIMCRSLLPGEILYFISSMGKAFFDPSFWKISGPDLSYCVLDRKDWKPAVSFFWIAVKGLLSREMRRRVFHTQ